MIPWGTGQAERYVVRLAQPGSVDGEAVWIAAFVVILLLLFVAMLAGMALSQRHTPWR